MTDLQRAITDYYAVRTANALDLAVEQVRTLNNIERNHGEIEVKIDGKRVEVEYEDEDEIHRTAFVLADGSLDYSLGGLLPWYAKKD